MYFWVRNKIVSKSKIFSPEPKEMLVIGLPPPLPTAKEEHLLLGFGIMQVWVLMMRLLFDDVVDSFVVVQSFQRREHLVADIAVILVLHGYVFFQLVL